MKKKLIIESSLDSLPIVVKKIIDFTDGINWFAFFGSLGAGKTTLIKELLAIYGVNKSLITSPTFTYYNIYKDQTNKNYYHFDLYRMESLKAFCEMGFFEVFEEKNAAFFIEWPESIMELFVNPICYIIIEYGALPDQRVITVEIFI